MHGSGWCRLWRGLRAQRARLAACAHFRSSLLKPCRAIADCTETLELYSSAELEASCFKHSLATFETNFNHLLHTQFLSLTLNKQVKRTGPCAKFTFHSTKISIDSQSSFCIQVCSSPEKRSTVQFLFVTKK